MQKIKNIKKKHLEDYKKPFSWAELENAIQSSHKTYPFFFHTQRNLDLSVQINIFSEINIFLFHSYKSLLTDCIYTISLRPSTCLGFIFYALFESSVLFRLFPVFHLFSSSSTEMLLPQNMIKLRKQLNLAPLINWPQTE